MVKIKEKHLISRQMQAVIFHGPQDLRLETVIIPELKAGEVLIKIKTALTCGTDFKAYRQGHPVLLNNRLPSPFGHEFSGTLIEKAPDVTQFEVNERVIAANSAPCDACYYCQRDLPNLCEKRFLLNGAYAECIVVPQNIVKHNLYRLADNIPDEIAAMTEPLACVVRAYEGLALEKGQSLALLGSGFMGLLFVQLAVSEGIRVTVISRSHDKLELAKSLGAHEIISTLDLPNTELVITKARAFSPEGRGFDAVVEAVGNPEAWKMAADLARPGGSVCFYGGCKRGSKVEVDTAKIHYDEIKIYGTFHHTPQHFKRALELLNSGNIQASRLLNNEQIALSALPEHFRARIDQPFFKTSVRCN